MTSREKADLMKNTIFHLYSKEGRSISYISKLLEINRRTLSEKIKEWKLPEPEPIHHLNPSTQKFINKNRNLIKSRLDHDISITAIAKELKVTRDFLQKCVIPNDEVLDQARRDYKGRIHSKHQQNIELLKEKSARTYDFADLDGEIWKPILGYPDYYISNMGRVKKYIKRYQSYFLLEQQPNKNNDRLYVTLTVNNKRKNIQVANLVGHHFVNGYTKEKHTINHKDGNVQNNCYWNLEWNTQADNNLHSYQVLHRDKVRNRRYLFQTIRYKEKYEFKTVSAFARFLGMSETQTRRYLDNPGKHEIELIN